MIYIFAGVVWLLLEGIPNAGQAINLIKDEGKHYKFISNNSMRTDEQYLQKFKETGVQNVNKVSKDKWCKIVCLILLKNNYLNYIF